MQNSYNFRKFVRRVETDEHGYFRFSDVPGDEPYFVFALPPGEDNAMRNFEYFGVGAGQRELWRRWSCIRIRVVGTVDGGVVFSPAARSTADDATGHGGREGAVHGEIEARSERRKAARFSSFASTVRRSESSGRSAPGRLADSRSGTCLTGVIRFSYRGQMAVGPSGPCRSTSATASRRPS